MAGDDSQSSSEDREDGLFTATDVIKQEVKRMEKRLSDQDLIKLKEANDTKWQLNDPLNPKKQSESFRAKTSEPLTESIMKIRSKPGSALIGKQGKKSFPSPLARKFSEDDNVFEPEKQAMPLTPFKKVADVESELSIGPIIPLDEENENQLAGQFKSLEAIQIQYPIQKDKTIDSQAKENTEILLKNSIKNLIGHLEENIHPEKHAKDDPDVKNFAENAKKMAESGAVAISDQIGLIKGFAFVLDKCHVA